VQPRDLGALGRVGGSVILAVPLCSFRFFQCPSVLGMAREPVDEYYTLRCHLVDVTRCGVQLENNGRYILDRRKWSFIQHCEALLVDCDLVRHGRSQ